MKACNKFSTAPVSRPLLGTALAVLFSHSADAGEPVYAPAVWTPFGMSFQMTPGDADTVVNEIRLADVDGDADLDMIFDLHSWQNRVYPNIMTPRGWHFIENIGTPSNPRFADTVVLNPFNLPWVTDTIIGLNTVPYLTAFSFSDFDDDGDPDLLYNVNKFSPDSTKFFYCQNTGSPGSPNFAAPIRSPFNLTPFRHINRWISYSFDVVDFDFDGDLDILQSPELYSPDQYTSARGYAISFYKNIGTASAANFQKIELLRDTLKNHFGEDRRPTLTVEHPSAFDYDTDGDIDLVHMGYFTNFDTIPGGLDPRYLGLLFRNNGNPAKPFTKFEVLTYPDVSLLLEVHPYPYLFRWFSTFGDLDNDNDQDWLIHEPSFYASNYKRDFQYMERIGDANNMIGGFCYLDANKNAVADSGDVRLRNIVVGFQRTGSGSRLVAITDSFGVFSMPAVDGNYFVSAVPPNENFTSVPNSVTINTTDTIQTYKQNFAIQAVDNIQDLSLRITSGPVRPGFTIPFWLTFKNEGTGVMSGSVVLTKDNRFTYIGSSIPPASQSGDDLSWNFSNLAPLSTKLIRIDLRLATTAVLGDTVSSLAVINPQAGDAEPANNRDTVNTVITGSYDPNDKLVTPQGEGSNGNIEPGTNPLVYTIRFQNTGTDTAFTVIVTDSLDGDFDFTTLKVLGSSHALNSNTRNGNTLRFAFDNIQLPDSNVNEPASHGFVKYSIKPQVGLAVGSQFHNTANIYFDYNLPITTNTTVNTFFVPTGVRDQINKTYRLFPNPMHTKAVLHFDNISGENFEFKLMDMTGKVLRKTITTGTVEIERLSLAPGMYLFSLEGKTDKASGKLVVE